MATSAFLSTRVLRLLLLFLAILCWMSQQTARALPAFAQQTGQRCVACHAGGQFPELTPFGRTFKLTGYTIGTRRIPISAMAVASYTNTATPTEDSAFAKNAVALFQTGSVFLAGKISDKVGVFAQATYNNYDSRDPDTGEWKGKWTSDNVDLRYVEHLTDNGRDWLFGLSLTNNPSIADPWNTAPAWIQYVPTQFGVTGPDAVPIVSQLGAQVAGTGVYAMWNGMVYAELSGYQTANGFWSFLSQGVSNVDQVKLKGVNPYVRLALTRDWGPHSAMVGLLALNANVYPDNLNPVGPTTNYRDWGVDAQYQYLLDPHTVTLQLSAIRESIDQGDISGIAEHGSNTLHQLRAKASYVFKAKYGASLSYFQTTGTSDSILYPDAARNPDTRGWVPELFVMPVPNVRVGAQYFSYNRFHGAAKNYDGAGRSAHDNNTLFVYAWAAY
jgi:hypothetical protein